MRAVYQELASRLSGSQTLSSSPIFLPAVHQHRDSTIGRRMTVKPFQIDVSTEAIDDLRERLGRTRWPDEETVDDWSQGVPLYFIKDLCEYWRDGYDWNAAKCRLNRFPQFREDVGDLRVHFIHVRSAERNALPLLLTHGWPGSILEFSQVIGPLSDPLAHGGDGADAFDIVCPSLPGYGFSDKPTTIGWGVDRIAQLWVSLMSHLRYDRYGAQGGDWGAAVTTALGRIRPPGLVGIHLNFVPVMLESDSSDLTDGESRALADLARHRRWEAGYSTQQSTRPQTLGYGLSDSPAAQCAWVIEKFRAWSDCHGDLLSVFSRDELLDNVMLYWLPGAGTSSARLYWESFRSRDHRPVDVPTACSIFPREISRPSRRWADRRFTNIHYWNEVDRGGHFAALEQPGLFVEEVRSAFRQFR